MFDVIHRMEREGIVKHTSLVDFQKIGYTLNVLMLVKTPLGKSSGLRTNLAANKNVNTLFQLSPVYSNGDHYDYLIEAVFRSQKDIQEFVEKLEEEGSITSKRIHYVVDAQKEMFLTKEEHFE